MLKVMPPIVFFYLLARRLYCIKNNYNGKMNEYLILNKDVRRT